MGQGSSRLNWTCTCEDGKFNISATYQEDPQEDQQECQNRHQGVSRSVPSRTAGVRKETLMPIIDDEMQDETGKGPAMSKKGSSTGMRRTFSSYELAQPRPSNAPAKRTPTTQVPKQYRSHEVLSSNSSAANTTESSGLSQSNSENSLHSSKSADSKLQRFIGLSNANKARQQQQTESSSRKSSIVNGLPTERKSSLNSSTASTVSTTERKSSVGDVDSLTELLKKKKKDARRAEIVANVTRRLYNAKKPEPKPEPVIEPPKPPQPEEDDVEPEELKLCMRARLQALSKRALSIHRGRRKGIDVEAQTDFQQQVLRVKEVAISTRDIFSEEFPFGYQVYDNHKQHLYLSDQAAWITFTRLFDPYREFYSYPSMRGQNNIWGNFHGEPKTTKSISSDDAFSDDSLEEVQVQQEEHSEPKVCGIISFASGDRFAPYEDSRTCSTQTDCCSICNGNHVPFPMENNHCHCKKSNPEVQVTLFNGLPLAGSEESQASVDDGYSSSNKEDEEVNVNNHDSPMLEIPDVDRMLYTITENSEQNSDCNEILSMENIDISKPPIEIPSAKVLSDKVVQASPEVFNLCYCKLHNNGTTLCSIKLNECLSNTSCDKVVQVSGYCDLCFYKGNSICSSQKFSSSDILPLASCCLCMCSCDKKLVPTLCSCAVQCSLDKENLKNQTTQTNNNVQKSYCSHGSIASQCSTSMCLNRQTDALLCEICSRRVPPDKSTENKNGKHLNSCSLCNNQCLDCPSGKKNVDTVLKTDAGTNTSRDLQILPMMQNQLQFLFGMPQTMKMSTLQYEDSIALFFGSPNSQPTMVRLVTRESVGIQTDSKNIYHCTSPPPQIVSVVEHTECYTHKTNNNNTEHQWRQPSTSAAATSLLTEAIHCTEEDNIETNYNENDNSKDDNYLDDFSDEDDMASLPRTTMLSPEADDSQNWSEMKNFILGKNKNLFPFYELRIEQDDNLGQRPQKKKSVSWSDLSGCGALHTEMVYDECLFDSSQPSVYNSEQRSIQEEDVPKLKRSQSNEVDALLMPVSKRRQIKKLCDMPRRSWSMLDMKDLLRKQINSEEQLSAFLHEATTLLQNLSEATMNHNEANINSINSNINTSFRSFISPPRCDHESNSNLLNTCSTDNHFPISKANKEHFNKDSRNSFPSGVYQKYCSHKSGQWNTKHPNGNCNLNLQEYDCLDNRYEVSEEINHYWHCHCQFVVPQKTFRNSPRAYMQHLVAIRRQIIQATSSSVQH